MKQYLLFAGHRDYPNGGMEDFYNDYDSLIQAQDGVQHAIAPIYRGWWHIYDAHTKKIVDQGEFDKYDTEDN